MNARNLIDALERGGTIVPALVSGLAPDDARWRPADGGWSILEIVSHLADEEVEDFRARLERTLRDPKEDWTPIDPEGWAVERRYNEGELHERLTRFVAARSESVQWLRGLDRPDWTLTHAHPKIGSMRAGDLLGAWVAHDALHVRQIAKRMHQIVRRDAGEFETVYAGLWPAES